MTTDDDGLADRLRLLRAHGSRRRDVHERLGTTSRLDSIQAAVLRAKLPRLAGWVAARAERAARYAERLAGCRGVTTPAVGPDETHVWNQYTIRCVEAPRVRASLDAEGVEWRHYYPTPALLRAGFRRRTSVPGHVSGGRARVRRVDLDPAPSAARRRRSSASAR